MRRTKYLFTTIALMIAVAASLANDSAPARTDGTPQWEVVDFADAAPLASQEALDAWFPASGEAQQCASRLERQDDADSTEGSLGVCPGGCSCCTAFGSCAGCTTTPVSGYSCSIGGQQGQLYVTRCTWMAACPPWQPACDFEGPKSCSPSYHCGL